MPYALRKLLLLQAAAVLRRGGRGLRTVKGALLAAVGLAMFLLWLVPALLATASAPAVDPAYVRDFAPLALLALTVAAAVSGGDKAISFTPAEVNFLFAGPFTRRQLLAYKLSKAAAGSVVMAGLLSVAARRFAPFWPAAFTGGLLALLFVNLCTAAAGLLRGSVEVRLQTAARQAAASVVLLAGAAGMAAAVTRGAPFLEHAAQILHSPAARVALAPLQPFARAYAADNLLDVVTWGGVALLIDAALLVLVMRLDANYLEAAAAAGERAYEQAQRLRRGDWMPGARPASPKARVPPFPFAGGAGPVARRQLTALLRAAPRLLLILLMTVATFAAVLMLARRVPSVRNVLFPAVGWLTVLLGGMLRFDFRGDLDHLPWLKSLPLRPLPLTAGQLVVPAGALSLFHVVAFACVAAFIEPLRGPALAAIALAAPLDLLLVGVENLSFLLFPHRHGPPTELGAMGRQMVLFLLKMLAVALAVGIAAGAAGIAFLLTRSTAAAVATAAVVLGVEALALVPVIAVAYRKFDPGSDLPP